MVGGTSIVFCWYAEKDVTKVRSHICKDAKTCQSVVGFDANSLYLYFSGQEMPCGKEEYVKAKEPTNPQSTEKICKDILDDTLFGFCWVDIIYLNILKKNLASFHLCLWLIAFLKS